MAYNPGKEIDEKFRFIDAKLKNSFKAIKDTIGGIKENSEASRENLKEIEKKLTELNSELKQQKFGKEIKKTEIGVSKELELQKQIERLNFQIEREKQKNVLDKEKSKYISKISELRMKLREKGELRVIKKQYEKQLVSISDAYKESQKKLILHAENNNKLVKNIEDQRKKDFNKFLAEKNTLSDVYDLKLKEMDLRNMKLQEDLIVKMGEISKDFGKSLRDSNKRFEKALNKIEDKRQEDNLIILRQLSQSSKEETVKKVEINEIGQSNKPSLWDKIKAKFTSLKSDKKEVSDKPKHDGTFWKVIPYVFLAVLALLAVNQYFKWDFITAWNWQISVLAIISGGLTFWNNRHKINSEMDDEKNQEELKENIRKQEFQFKFPTLNKIPLVRGIAKWIYKEGWYAWALIGIVVLGFVLRVWNLNYLPGADNFNILAAKALYQTGHFVYPGELQATYGTYLMFKLFGVSLATARIIPIFFGIASIFMIYFLGRLINRKVGIVSSFLLAVSPWAIELSSFVRPYSELLFFSILITILLLNLERRKTSSLKIILTSVTIIILIGLYRFITNTELAFSLILNVILLLVCIFGYRLYTLKKNYIYIYLATITTFSIAFLYLAPLFWKNFASGGVFNFIWIRYFIDPSVSVPMQWFSFSTISLLFILFILFIPLLIKNKHLFYYFIIFFASVFLFILKYNNRLGFNHSRYLYHIFPFYIILFSAGLCYLFSLIKVINYKKIGMIILIIFIFSSIIIVPNVFHSANHDLSIWKINNADERQPSAAGNRNFYYEILDYLEENNFTKEDTILIEGEHPFYIEWYFDCNLNRSYTNSQLSLDYDACNNVYFIGKSAEIDESLEAINFSSSGYFLTYKNYKDSYLNQTLLNLGKTEGYNLYYWENNPLD